MALPDPRYLALHSALAEIMATGNIWDFLEKILFEYDGVTSWPQLEDWIETEKLKDSIADTFRSVNVD